jgi:antirestriction protein
MTHEHQPEQPQPGETPALAPLPETSLSADAASNPVPNPEAEQPDSPEAAEPRLHPRIWVGSLLDYNAGILHGDWIDAPQTDEAIREQVTAILASSPTTAETGEPAEEWGIFDHDDFGGYQVQEYDWLEDVARIARGIRDHGPAFAAWADLHDGDQDMLDQFEEAYLGEYDSPEAWAETVMDDLGIQARLEQELHGDMARYVSIDTGAWVQDAWLSGDIAIVHKPGGGVWIFQSR